MNNLDRVRSPFGQTAAHTPKKRSMGEKYLIDFLSGVTAGAFYHPLRVMADRAIKADKTPFHPRMLKEGMRYTLLSSHQLVLMGLAMSTLDYFFPEEKKGLKAIAAGCATTFTATPLDVFLAQKGWAKPLYRGFTPTLYRQAILGLGFFVFTKEFQNKIDPGESSQGLKIACNFAGGVAASLLSHPFDMSRVKMQNDINGVVYPKFRDALWHTMTQETREKVLHSLAMRFGIVVIASIVMNIGKEAWGWGIDTFKEGEE